MENELDLRRYFAMVRRWLWLIVICALLAAGSAYIISSRKTPVYGATATLLIRPAPSSRVSDYTALLTSERLAQTYVQMLSSRPVLGAVAAQLGLPGRPAVSASVIRDTQMIRLSVMDTNPVRAAEVANAVAETFIAQNREMQQERYADSLTGMQGQMDELSALVEETQAAIDELGTPTTAQQQTELARLETTLAGYRNTYAVLRQSYEQMRLTAAQSADDVIVFESAQVPRGPVGPRTLTNTALAGVVGAMLAVGVAFLVEYLDDTIKTPDDVSQALGLGTLGAIGRLAGGEEEMVTIDKPLSPISEAFRVLRTNVRFSSVDRPLRTLLVTSPRATEGKSITVANLAVAMAQAGLRVVVVDADLRRPRQHKLFDLHPRGGLTGSLLEESTDGRLQPAQVEGLRVLPAGELPPNPAEMVGSRRMRELLDGLAQEVDMVLVDSPPVLPVTDAAALAQGVDGVLLVVDVGETRRGMARQAVESLRQVGANPIGVVLNRVPTRRGGYYYYYHEYYEDEDKKRKRRRRRQEGPLAAVRRLLGRRGAGEHSGARDDLAA